VPRRSTRVPLLSVAHLLLRKVDTLVGRFRDLDATLAQIDLKPPSINFELTNICNANCVFCGYQYQERPKALMSDAVFDKALGDFVACGGGDAFLTPIVGEATVDPKFLDRITALRAQPAIADIRVITNGILLDRFGVDNVVRSGLTGIFISTAGFDEETYRRLYRSADYQRMRRNVLALLEARARLGVPLQVTIGLRPDRPLSEVLADRDFQPILAHEPHIEAVRTFADFGGKIKPSDLRGVMKLRVLGDSATREPCKNLYDGPTVLPDGTVIICSCAAAMDAVDDLAIGHVMEQTLLEMWKGEPRRRLIAQFRGEGSMNQTCAACTSYRSLDFYRTTAARKLAAENKARAQGEGRGRFHTAARPRLHN
jgi:MoaA/NifB/PqqE/SkfB family radical SAM enzyme